jgi:hypothetical protein
MSGGIAVSVVPEHLPYGPDIPFLRDIRDTDIASAHAPDLIRRSLAGP